MRGGSSVLSAVRPSFFFHSSCDQQPCYISACRHKGKSSKNNHSEIGAVAQLVQGLSTMHKALRLILNIS